MAPSRPSATSARRTRSSSSGNEDSSWRRRPGGCPAGVLARRAEGETPSGQPARCRRYGGPRHSHTVEELIGELAQKLPLVHAVLEGLVAVDEDDWNLIVEPAAKFTV